MNDDLPPGASLKLTRTDPDDPAFRVRYMDSSDLWSAPRLTQVVDVRHARMIYLSGQAPADAAYKVGSNDFRAQMHKVFDNIEAALAVAGATLADIVKTTTYITDAAHRDAMREVRAARLGHLKAPPANTALVVASLIEPEFLVEVDVVAAVPLR
jgi:enamine deaminase RidA (YjgF/YER057c/UK114 family)